MNREIISDEAITITAPIREAAVGGSPEKPIHTGAPSTYVPACGVLLDVFWWTRGCRVQPAPLAKPVVQAPHDSGSSITLVKREAI